MAAETSCIVTNCESAVLTLPAHEKASLLGGSYHQLITAGPMTLHATKPRTAPTAALLAVRFTSDVPGTVCSPIVAGYTAGRGPRRSQPATHQGVREPEEIRSLARRSSRPRAGGVGQDPQEIFRP